MKKYIVEFGLGTDFHGQDVTKAAAKAAKDAISRSCLCGLEQVLGLTDFRKPGPTTWMSTPWRRFSR